jgi:succinoglycan biosynthesis transport protein ExoP
MNLLTVLRPLQKWWWLIIVSMVLAAFSSYIASRNLPPVYLARATLMIGRALTDPNPSTNELSLSQQLAQTYADIAMRDPVQDAVKSKLGLTVLPKNDVHPLFTGPFIEITVTDNNPKLAQAVAAEIADQLISQSPASLENTDQSRQQFVLQQISDLQNKIKETQDQITSDQEALSNLTSAVDIEQTKNEILTLENKLNTLQGIYANLLASTQQGATNTLSILEPAALPTKPIGPNKMLIVAVAILGAMILSGGAVYAIELLDDTIRDIGEIHELTELPILGRISVADQEKMQGVYVVNSPRSSITESFRALRTNLEFMEIDHEIKSIFIASTQKNEGKTWVASNLAATLAQGGKKIAIVDADLRKPSLHQIFDIPNTRGLRDVFLGKMDIQDCSESWGEERISVIPSGPPPPNPSDILGSKRMDKILEILEQAVDIVIFDGPPLFVSDALLLASKVDGVIIIVNPGRTHRKEFLDALDQCKFAGARVLGIVVNKISLSRSKYNYYYDEKSEENRPQKTMKRRTFNLKWLQNKVRPPDTKLRGSNLKN